MGPIQVIPPGLLGFLQLKSHGHNPSELDGSYRAVLELRDWILQAGALYTNGSTGNISNGAVGLYNLASGTTTVPEREWWYVHEACARVIGHVDSTDTIQAGVAYTLDPAGAAKPIIVAAPLPVVSAGTQTSPVTVARNFFVPAGSALAAWVVEAAIVAGTKNVLIDWRYTPLPI